MPVALVWIVRGIAPDVRTTIVRQTESIEPTRGNDPATSRIPGSAFPGCTNERKGFRPDTVTIGHHRKGAQANHGRSNHYTSPTMKRVSQLHAILQRK